MDLQEQSQREDTKMIRGLKHFYEDRLREPRLFSLENKVLGRPYCTFQYFKVLKAVLYNKGKESQEKGRCL